MPLARSRAQASGAAAFPLTSRPAVAARPSSASGVSKRVWNPPPTELFPAPEIKPKLKTRAAVRPATARVTREQLRAPATAVASANASQHIQPAACETGRKLSQVTRTRLRRASQENASAATEVGEMQTDGVGAVPPLHEDPKRQQLLAREAELEAARSGRRRDPLHSAHILQSLRRQDVEADDVRPLIEIAYWSPFVEVRRDAAAALASLSRNSANLEMLDSVGALGALLTMLSAQADREDAGISRDCAQTLVALVRLPTVKTKLLQAPGGIDCVFSLLHATTDQKLRLAGFEVLVRLVATDDWREAVAKREGFAFMLSMCSGGGASRNSRMGGRGGDPRTRALAAAVLHQLAASRDNRLLFYHSGHFSALAELLRDPFLDKDAAFRRELLSFVRLLLSETENARRFASLGLLPCVLAVLGRGGVIAGPSPSLQVSLLVVSILETVASDSANHEALVQAGALPRLVQLCFSTGGEPSAVGPGGRRPRTAAAASARSFDMKAPPTRPASASTLRARSRSASVLLASETNAVLRVVLGIFCAMAHNPQNREPVIRSKVLDHIATRELYASPDKRVRRAVITLLTSLICTERERMRRRSSRVQVDHAIPAPQEIACTPASERDYQHYIELLARGVVKCLFGILAGDDFGMKVDALGALAQLTQDAPSRLTLCKPALLRALQEFAFHPLATTRLHVAQIVANFAERPENVLKLVDAGLLAVLVRYVSPMGHGVTTASHGGTKGTGDALLLEATRALAAVSELHVARGKLVESGVLPALLRLARASSTSSQVCENALNAVRNLRHDAAALRIQAIYRGWQVRSLQRMNLINAGCRRRLRRVSRLGQASVRANIGAVASPQSTVETRSRASGRAKEDDGRPSCCSK